MTEHGCPWNHRVCAVALGGGHMDVLRWAREHGCAWDSWTRCEAARRGYREDTTSQMIVPSPLPRSLELKLKLKLELELELELELVSTVLGAVPHRSGVPHMAGTPSSRAHAPADM